MATVRISLRDDGLADAIRRLGRRSQTAIPRAINRTLMSSRTAVTREVAKDMGLLARDVRERIIVDRAHKHKFNASLRASGKRLPLILFGARGPYPSRGRGRGVSVRTPARRLPHAFLARMRGGPWAGQMGVLQREGKGRTPVFQKFGPSIYHAFQKFSGVAEARAQEVLQKNMQHEFRWALSQE